MANITRIKAKDDGGSKKKEAHSSDEPAEVTRKVTVKAKNSDNKKSKKADRAAAKKLDKAEKKAAKKNKDEKPLKECFFLFIPFIALGRYIRDSFRELRQVRWPNRKETWKLVFSVIIYVILISGFIMLLDMLFNFLFSKVYGGN